MTFLPAAALPREKASLRMTTFLRVAYATAPALNDIGKGEQGAGHEGGDDGHEDEHGENPRGRMRGRNRC